MRGLAGHVVAAAIAALVATVWALARGNGESLITAFRLPDVVAYAVPDLAIGLRRLVGFYREASPAVGMLIDFPAGLVIFLVLNIPGAALLGAAESTWGDASGWRTLKPLWGGLSYAVMAATFVLSGLDYGWPLLGDLTLSPIGCTLAALFAGAILGLVPPREPDPHPW